MEGATTMLEMVTSTLTTVIGWVGTVINALITTDGELNAIAPLFVISISVSALLLGAKVLRSFIWGA